MSFSWLHLHKFLTPFTDESVEKLNILFSSMNRKQKQTQKLKITCITELVDSWFRILVGGNHVFWQKSEVDLGFIDCYFVLCFVCRNI